MTATPYVRRLQAILDPVEDELNVRMSAARVQGMAMVIVWDIEHDAGTLSYLSSAPMSPADTHKWELRLLVEARKQIDEHRGGDPDG